MALVLNGSGSIAGLSAGGISDAGAIADAAMGAGAVLQVVSGTYSTQAANATTTYADTGLSASITPSSTSNKILVLVNHPSNYSSASNSQNALNIRLFRGSTEIAIVAYNTGYTNTTQEAFLSESISYLDSPATTSSVTYKTQFKNNTSANEVRVQQGNQTSTIILMEIAG